MIPKYTLHIVLLAILFCIILSFLGCSKKEAPDPKKTQKDLPAASNSEQLFFTAKWCLPCKKMYPIVKEVEKEAGVKFQKIDFDINPDLVRQYQVQALPTFIFLKNGEETGRIVGMCTKQDLLDQL